MHDTQMTGELDASDVRKEVRINAVTTGYLLVRVVHVTVRPTLFLFPFLFLQPARSTAGRDRSDVTM